jgi:histidine triad (HIT) family protein
VTSSAPDANCLFCKIVAGEIPATLVAETADTVAFRDINPQAPTHVLVIPRVHHADVGAMAAADPGLAGRLAADAAAVAKQEGLDNGWRLVFNTGADAGQTVFHVHGHVLGGRHMTWPPG